MKRCPYCGAEYSDDAMECAIDTTPLVEPQSEPDKPRKHIKFAIFSEYQIPVSLAIVSYFFFVPAAICFAGVIAILALLILSGGEAASPIAMLCCIGCGAIGMFWLLLSRGLRKCSRRWRICALVLLWWGFAGMTITVIRYFLTHQAPNHETSTEFFAVYAFGFIVQIWQYRVLTRPDIRDLFGV
jgi:hypothetical protein